jgi:hypothetical protein
MMTAYKAAVDDFSAWMASADTDPCIATYFSSVLSGCSFLPEDEEYSDQWMPEEMIPVMEEQQAIGGDNLLFGCLSTRWMKLQQHHLQSKCSRKSPERWATDMPCKLLQISHKLWTTRNGILHERNEQGLLILVVIVTMLFALATLLLTAAGLYDSIAGRSDWDTSMAVALMKYGRLLGRSLKGV